MIDADDREALALWAIRGLFACLAIIGTGVSFGAAFRLFELIRG